MIKLENEIAKALSEYSQEVTDKIKKAVDIVAAEVDAEIKSKIPFTQRTGKYVRSFRIKNTYENQHAKTKVWHVADGQHRLTHLLEHGHAKLTGGRVKAYPHVQYGEDLAVKRMQELAREAVQI